MAHAGGRPTKYTPDRVAKAWQYLECYEDIGDKIPSLQGLYLYIDISETCGERWAGEEDKQEFKGITKKCMLMQAQKLINNGLDGTFNSPITKLILTKHGFSDKMESKIDGEVKLTDMSSDELDRKILQLQSLQQAGIDE
jgi:DNA-packaging protein gp3